MEALRKVEPMTRIELGDLILTKDALYRLSYIGCNCFGDLERETGLEPATPSLEGSRSSQLSYSPLELN